MGSSTPPPNAPGQSLSGLVATLAPTFLVAAVYVLIFLCLRKSNRRFYAPRTYLGTLKEEERTEPLPNGMFNWISPFWKIPDTYALQHQSLDAYLFLRFLRMCVVIMFVGCCITWPVLFPVYITGGGGGNQLDLLSMSNINKSGNGKYRYLASCGIGSIFFGFVLMLVTRESIFYVNLRQAFLLSPSYANRISARTVLFTSVPVAYRNEAKLRRVFGPSVQRIWITRDSKSVDELVEERDKVALKLEASEVKLIKLANGARLKSMKNEGDEPSMMDPGDVESGTVAARWLPDKKRPTHRLGKFGLYGQKVDTIDWSRSRLETLIPATEAAQASYRAGEVDAVGSVFIEFAQQSDAQSAFQTLAHHQALQMSPRYIGINPNEIVWKSLSMSWWQRVVRRFAVLGFITVMIVFWAIPVAFVGLISNIEYLETYSWLSWLEKVPQKLMGIISGLLPAVALSILMSLVPVIMRLCAKLSGEPSLSRVELFTQNAYFVFQVVQVFLVVTIASSASSVVKGIIADPSSAVTLLGHGLPKASNFYISYFIVQGLTIASGVVSQVVGFVIFRLLYKYMTATPRSLYTKWANLSAISWGSTLPVFTNIAVIGLTYACIAPLVLGFAAIGMFLFYLAYRYNILFVTDAQIDTKGLIYPRALQQLLTGVYIGEVLMIALFGIAESPIPLVLMVLFLVFTVLYHVALNGALGPLLYNLPKTLDAEDGEEEEEEQRLLVGDYGDDEMKEKATGSTLTTPSTSPKRQNNLKPNFLTKFLKPHIYADFTTLSRLVPHNHNSTSNPETLYDPTTASNAYHPPSVSSTSPLLWLPRDEAGVSAHAVREVSRILPVTDEGCVLDGRTNKLVWDPEGARPPLWEERIVY